MNPVVVAVIVALAVLGAVLLLVEWLGEANRRQKRQVQDVLADIDVDRWEREVRDA